MPHCPHMSTLMFCHPWFYRSSQERGSIFFPHLHVHLGDKTLLILVTQLEELPGLLKHLHLHIFQSAHLAGRGNMRSHPILLTPFPFSFPVDVSQEHSALVLHLLEVFFPRTGPNRRAVGQETENTQSNVTLLFQSTHDAVKRLDGWKSNIQHPDLDKITFEVPPTQNIPWFYELSRGGKRSLCQRHTTLRYTQHVGKSCTHHGCSSAFPISVTLPPAPSRGTLLPSLLLCLRLTVQSQLFAGESRCQGKISAEIGEKGILKHTGKSAWEHSDSPTSAKTGLKHCELLLSLVLVLLAITCTFPSLVAFLHHTFEHQTCIKTAKTQSRMRADRRIICASDRRKRRRNVTPSPLPARSYLWPSTSDIFLLMLSK